MRAYGAGHFDTSLRKCKVVKSTRARERRLEAAEVSDQMAGALHAAELRLMTCDDSCGALCPLCWGD